MSDYAKIFKSKKYGQIVVLNHTNDAGYPAVETFFKSKQLGVSSFSIVFGPKDSDKGWDEDKAYKLADSAFQAITAESSESAVTKILKQFKP